jgi:hypothetical protein
VRPDVGGRVSFFLCAESIVELFSDCETQAGVMYTCAGVFDTASVPQYRSIRSIPELGRSSGSQNLDQHFLVSSPDRSIARRTIHLGDGGIRTAIDEMANPDAVTVCFGGAFSPDVLICGSAASTSDGPFSRALLRSIRARLRKIAQRHEKTVFWLDEYARRRLCEGARLAGDVDSPPLYDLKP